MGMTYSVRLKFVPKEDQIYQVTPEDVKKKFAVTFPADTKIHLNDDLTLSADFDAGYGFETALDEGFRKLAPFLKDGSYMDVYPDNAFERFVVKNGSVENYVEDDAIIPEVSCEEDIKNLVEWGNALYNEKTGCFVTEGLTDGSLISYKISKSVAREAAKYARENNSSWLEYLNNKMLFAAQIIPDYNVYTFLEEIMEEGSDEEWILAGSCADFYALCDEQ